MYHIAYETLDLIQKTFDSLQSACFTMNLSCRVQAAHLQDRPAARLVPRETAALVLIGQQIDVGSDLLVTGGPMPSSVWVHVAEALWFLGLALWVVLVYVFFIAVTVEREKPALEDGLNGGWLLLVVSTESVAVLGARLAPALDARWVLFVSIATYLIGSMLYVLVIGLVFYRWTFFSMSPDVV